MSLKAKLREDLTAAIRSRDELRSATLRMVLAAITTEEVAGKEARVLADSEVVTVLTREAKKRREAAEAFEQGGASERAEREKSEGAIIAEYLPTQLSQAELETLVKEAISATGATGPSGMGVVMKFLQPKIAGRVDGSAVAQAVRFCLESPDSVPN